MRSTRASTAYARRFEHFGRQAVRQHAVRPEQHHPVAEARCEIQIVHRDDDDRRAAACRVAHRFQREQLPAQVERARRLVEQQERRVPHQYLREADHLALAARQAVERLHREPVQA
ncbi:hypothetical protein AQ610_01260 [Burkholderia humptydooensis]|nr:hypothetical protein AQ610_01260 [Burkholderia humptydooensis]